MVSKTSSSPSKWENYFALTATSLTALSLAPSEASAAVVKVLDRPVALPSVSGVADWDVDGNGAIDFSLINYYSYVGAIYSNALFGSPKRGRGMVGPAVGNDQVSKLSSNFVVGPALASNNWGPSLAVRTITYLGGFFNYLEFKQFQAGDNYFGFRFDKEGDGNLHYGFAIANINDPVNNPQFTITEWAYNDVANEPVTVGPLNADPASVPGPIGLAGLAAGAAWSRRLRKRIRQAS